MRSGNICLENPGAIEIVPAPVDFSLRGAAKSVTLHLTFDHDRKGAANSMLVYPLTDVILG
jgi:hypothetical protein